MSIVLGDIKFYLTGGAANADVDASLGGTTSSVLITTASLNNLFDEINAAEALGGDSEYRAIAIKNTNVTDTAYNAVFYCEDGASEGSASTYTMFALDSGTQTVADESTAPSSPSLTFGTHEGVDNGLALGDIAPEAEVRVWLKRICNAGAAAYSEDKQTLKVRVQTV